MNLYDVLVAKQAILDALFLERPGGLRETSMVDLDHATARLARVLVALGVRPGAPGWPCRSRSRPEAFVPLVWPPCGPAASICRWKPPAIP